MSDPHDGQTIASVAFAEELGIDIPELAHNSNLTTFVDEDLFEPLRLEEGFRMIQAAYADDGLDPVDARFFDRMSQARIDESVEAAQSSAR